MVFCLTLDEHVPECPFENGRKTFPVLERRIIEAVLEAVFEAVLFTVFQAVFFTVLEAVLFTVLRALQKVGVLGASTALCSAFYTAFAVLLQCFLGVPTVPF